MTEPTIEELKARAFKLSRLDVQEGIHADRIAFLAKGLVEIAGNPEIPRTDKRVELLGFIALIFEQGHKLQKWWQENLPPEVREVMVSRNKKQINAAYTSIPTVSLSFEETLETALRAIGTAIDESSKEDHIKRIANLLASSQEALAERSSQLLGQTPIDS